MRRAAPALLDVGGALATASLLIVLGLLVGRTIQSYPSFDGAMNLNVARSVAEGHGYGFCYDSFFAFPAQTDGPFILPAALDFRLFGIGPFTCQLISSLYLVAFALVVQALLRRMGAPRWLAAVASLACLLTPGLSDYGASGFGEIPMLTWLLAGCLTAGRRRFGWSGVLFGLAVLTKTVAILCAVPALLLCAVFICIGEPGRRLRGLGRLAGGLLLPLLGWELFRLAALEGVAAWANWWTLQLGQVDRQSGARGFTGAGAALTKLRLHLALLSAQTRVPIAWLSCWLALPWLLALTRLASRRLTCERAFLTWLLLACPALYAGWWLLVTPDDMAWLRRMLPGLLLQTCLVAALMQGLVESPEAGRWRAARALLPVLLVLPGQMLMLRSGLLQWLRPVPAFQRQDTDRMVAALRSLPPDAVIFGVGWWQAPLFALLSDRTFMNFNLWDPARINALPHKYLVVDPAATELAGSQLRQVAAQATLVPLLRGREDALYRIVAVDPDRALDHPGPLASGFDGIAVAQTSGWYLPDGGWAWVSPESRIRLGRSDQTRLAIDAAFWDELFIHGPRRLHVVATGCLDQAVTIPSSGTRHIVLPLHCAPSSTPVPITIALSFDGALPRFHQLDAETRDLAYQVRRLMLER